MLLMIDNYDLFTYSLVEYFRVLGEEVEVVQFHPESYLTEHGLTMFGNFIGGCR